MYTKQQRTFRLKSHAVEPGSGINRYREPGSGIDRYREPGSGINRYREPGSGYREPGSGINRYREPGSGINRYREPGSGINRYRCGRTCDKPKVSGLASGRYGINLDKRKWILQSKARHLSEDLVAIFRQRGVSRHCNERLDASLHQLQCISSLFISQYHVSHFTFTYYIVILVAKS